MQIREKKYNYLESNQSFSFKEKLGNGVQINSYVILETEKFLEYQKDLLQDFLAEFVDKSNTEIFDEGDIKANLEEGLQNLNVKLQLFADKVQDVERFPIKGFMQIIAGDTLITSMIGDTSILIFRGGNLYYQLHNGVNKKSKIDVFSDFVEGDIETGDEILYAGTKIGDALDENDFNELENVLTQDENIFSDQFENIIVSRVEKGKIGFITNYYVHGNIVESNQSTGAFKSRKKLKLNKNWLKGISINKYYVIILILGVIILFMMYNVLSEILDTKNKNSFVTDSGTVIDITIDDIKKDIYEFQTMDVTSDEKSIKYNDIVKKLDLLEENGRWLEDVESLRGIVENDYYKGFNIIRIENLSQLDDITTGIKTRQISFNATEKSKMGEVLFIDYQKSINIGGKQGALIGAANDTSRGGLVEYGVDTDMKGCSFNLLRDGIYCYTSDGRVYNITKAGIEPVTTIDGIGFPDTIGGVGVYGKSNFYVFQPNLTNSSLNGVFVTRYRNVVGSEVSYQAGDNYKPVEGYESNVDFVGNFEGIAIDSTFLVRNNGKLYQFWRPSGTSLEVREIKLLGGDSITNKYSNNVKVLASSSSKYVYLFDRENKTFTVYTSSPLKTNDAYTSQYSLYYLFSFKFALTSEEVKDIAIPDSTGNNPEMYILTNEGVNKVNLYEYINSVVKDDTLKAIGNSAE